MGSYLMVLEAVVMIGIIEAAVQEYCVSDSFSATCKQGEVIIVTSAHYGRMHNGRCIAQDFGYLGCKVDVLSVLDRMCSGRRTCQFQVPLPELEALRPCIADLKSYLEADFECLEVIQPARRLCSSQTFARVASPHGYLASAETAATSCGSAVSPWLIEAPPGTRINLTLHDFSWTPRETSSRDFRTCYKYATIKDFTAPTDFTICDNHERLVHIMASSSHRIEVQMMTGDHDENQRHFLIEYTVIGCEDLPDPENGYAKRTNDVMVFGCHDNDFTWRQQCIDDEWSGPTLNCSYAGLSAGKSTSNRVKVALGLSLISHELSIIVIILTAVFITTIILVVGFICIKRHSEAISSVPADLYSPYDLSRTPSMTRSSFKTRGPVVFHDKTPLGSRPAMYYRGISRDSNDYAVIGEIIGPNSVAHGDCCHSDAVAMDQNDAAGCVRPDHESFKYDIPQYYELDQGVNRKVSEANRDS